MFGTTKNCDNSLLLVTSTLCIIQGSNLVKDLQSSKKVYYMQMFCLSQITLP